MSFEKICKLVDEFEKMAGTNNMEQSNLSFDELLKIIVDAKELVTLLSDEARGSTEQEVTRKSLGLIAERAKVKLHEALMEMSTLKSFLKHDEPVKYQHEQ